MLPESVRPFDQRIEPAPAPVLAPADAAARRRLRARCLIVRQMTAELLALARGSGQVRRDRRRLVCHIRQISIYVCHVVLRVPQQDLGFAFGLHPATVRHACHVVEDRRDDPDFDDFVSTVERLTSTVFLLPGGLLHD